MIQVMLLVYLKQSNKLRQIGNFEKTFSSQSNPTLVQWCVLCVVFVCMMGCLYRDSGYFLKPLQEK